MIFQSGMTRAIKSAERAIEKKSKISNALNSEVKRLSQTARRLVDAERELSDRSAAHLIEGGIGTVDDSAVSAIRAEIKRHGSTIAGLRAAIADCVPDFVNASEGLSSHLAAHNEAIINDLRAEWERAVAVFGALQGRRQALELAIGRKFDLSSPAPIEPDPKSTADALKPRELIAATGEFLQLVFETSSAPFRHPNAPAFDGSRVYELNRDVMMGDGLCLKSGELVMEQTFHPGFLAVLNDVGHVQPVGDSRVGTHSHTAKQALLNAAARLAEETRQAESGAHLAIKSESPVVIPEGLTYQDLPRATELPGEMQRRPESGSPLPWGDITKGLNSGKSV